jgi:uncharacterized protein (TIGR01777 family)
MVLTVPSRERYKVFFPAGGFGMRLRLFAIPFSRYKWCVKNVLVTGGTGFIGKRLVSALVNSERAVTVLGRDVGRIRLAFGGKARGLPWNLLESANLASELGAQHAVIHLAGEPAVGRRLTDALKRQVRNSRVKSTRRLVDALGQASTKPSVFVCASAVGIYGSSPGDFPLDETAAVGRDFMAEVCHEWESAALRAELFGVRVVLTRFGIVLGGRGGILARLMPLFRLGLGGRIGSGQQPMPWVSLDDAVAALEFTLDREAIRGPVNVVSPGCVNNEQFTRDLAQALGRSAIFRVPAAALRLALGEAADTILGGQRVSPAVLLREGFEFRYPELKLALAAAVAQG